jgi:hypothetical protein
MGFIDCGADYTALKGETEMTPLFPAHSTVQSGEVSGSATAKQLPDIPCRAVSITALVGNAGNVYLGGAGVTIPDGTTDTTSGLTLDAGVTTDWMPVTNLNLFYIICDNAGDDITYLALG